ncbi:MAG: IclR family transcriptional regulator [Methylobacteriaceae bacterium]|nr:IclR family transcriptional regulator [Methylobacteriaceae bacterium]
MSILSGAAAVLRLFSVERQELSVTDVARLLDMPKSSASRLLRAMLNQQLLMHAGDTPRYRVGHLIFETSRAYFGHSHLVDLVDGELLELCQATGHTGYISMLDNEDVLVLRVHLGTQPLRVVTPHGSRRKAFATSTGRSMLARLGAAQVDTLTLDHARSEKSPKTHAALEHILGEIRCKGWAEAEDEEIPGVASIAVSIADARKSELLSFCLVFPAHTIAQGERANYAARLVAAARRIAAQVDDPFWTQRHPLKIVAA